MRLRIAPDLDAGERGDSQFAVPMLRVGPFALENQQVVVCDDCASLLGQSTLERFDLQTTQKDGLEVLSMRLRPAGP